MKGTDEKSEEGIRRLGPGRVPRAESSAHGTGVCHPPSIHQPGCSSDLLILEFLFILNIFKIV